MVEKINRMELELDSKKNKIEVLGELNISHQQTNAVVIDKLQMTQKCLWTPRKF